MRGGCGCGCVAGRSELPTPETASQAPTTRRTLRKNPARRSTHASSDDQAMHGPRVGSTPASGLGVYRLCCESDCDAGGGGCNDSKSSQSIRTHQHKTRPAEQFNTHRSCCRSCCSVASHAHTMSLFSSFRATARWVVLECTSGAEMVRISFRRSFSTRAAAPFDVPRAAFDFDRDTERPPRALDREVDLC